LRSKAPQRVEVAPRQPEFLAALLARADQACRPALSPSASRQNPGLDRRRARVVS
jgi:hypothetical protein